MFPRQRRRPVGGGRGPAGQAVVGGLIGGKVAVSLAIGRLLDDTVGGCQAVGGGSVHAPGAAAPQLLERGAELLRHGVVDEWVDGAVEVDAEAAEEQEPGVQVGVVQEGVDQNQGPVRQPQHGEQNHHHRQHLGHLTQRRKGLKA